MPEVVLEEHLDSVRVLTQFGGDLRPSSGYLCDLLGLLLLELDLESGHVYRPIIAAAPRCVATSDISPRRSAYPMSRKAIVVAAQGGRSKPKTLETQTPTPAPLPPSPPAGLPSPP